MLLIRALGGGWKRSHSSAKLTTTMDAEGEIKRSIQEALLAAASLPASNEEHAVHEIRKTVKMARALLRLLGGGHKPDADALAGLGRKLSKLRDAEALLETFDELSEVCAEKFKEREIESIRGALLARKQEIQAGADLRDPVPSAARTLRRVARQIGARASGGIPIDSVFRKRARRAEKAFEKAAQDPDSDSLHEWRRRVKEQWNQLQVLKPGGNAAKPLKRLHTVGGWLGDCHNLFVLRETILENSRSYGGVQDVELFLTCAAKQERKLRKQALALGRKLYNRKAKRVLVDSALAMK